LDNDPRVIYAAKVKHPKAQYKKFDFNIDDFKSLELNRYRTICVIAVNVFQPDELSTFFNKIEVYKGDLIVMTDVISDFCPNPKDFPWIPEVVKNEKYSQIEKKYARDFVRDIIMLRRESIK
jgi:hypothetical protein